MIHLQNLLRPTNLMEVHQYKLNLLHTNGWFTNQKYISLNSRWCFDSNFFNRFTALQMFFQKNGQGLHTCQRFSNIRCSGLHTSGWFITNFIKSFTPQISVSAVTLYQGLHTYQFFTHGGYPKIKKQHIYQWVFNQLSIY